MNEILISGYYGFENSGDDALLQSIINDLKKQEANAEIVVLSKNPRETKKIYNVHAINRLNPIAVFYHMLKAKLLISGGGTLIQDATSTKSLIYYLGVISLARLLHVKVMLYANGIGPVTAKKNRSRTTKILNDVNCITLRDEKSLEALSELGIKKPYIKVTADPAFLLEASDKSTGLAILKRAGAPEGKRYLGISIREWKNSVFGFEDKIAEAINEACSRHDLFPIFLPMQPRDYAICESVAEKTRLDCAILAEHITVNDILSVVSCMHAAIGMRLHMLIYSAAVSVPIAGIVYDPKISGFMDYAGQDKYVDAKSFDACDLVKCIDEIMNNYDEIKNNLENTTKALKIRARENGVAAGSLLKEGKK